MISSKENYGDDIFSMINEKEEQRLKYLALSYDDFSKHHIENLSLNKHPRCLDIGSGLGSIPVWLSSSRSIDAAEVVALDKDTTLIGKRLKSSNKIVIEKMDITDIEASCGQFDYIHTRFIMEHLTDRDKVIEKLITWLKPGGWLTTTSYHWDDSQIKEGAYKTVMNALFYTLNVRVGTDLQWIEEIGQSMKESGSCAFIKERHNDVREIIDPLCDFWVATLESLKDFLMKNKNITEDIFHLAISEVRQSLLSYYQPCAVSISVRPDPR